MSTAASAPTRAVHASPLTVPLRIAWLLNRPGTTGRTAALLPAASFAVVTTLLLTVLAGALSFLQWGTGMVTFICSSPALRSSCWCFP